MFGPCLNLPDCRQCTKRRIKCDRSIPSCRKCTIRKFQCPGYDPIQLSWSHGRAASRHATGALRTRQVDDQSQILPSTPKSHTPGPNKKFDNHTTTILHPDLRILPADPLTDRCLVDSYTWSTCSSTLFTHFSCHVTPRLTWVDRPDHPWRTVISPLAKRSTCLRLSVLSLAAAHLSVTSPTSPIKARTISRCLRDSSVRILNQKISLELAGSSLNTDSLSRQLNVIEIMTTTLVLCYGEMMIPDSTDWNLHLHACRTLIETYRWRDKPGLHANAIDFVLKEVADIEVFRNMGAFSKGQIFVTDTLRPKSSLDSYFKTFMGVFREITSEERSRQNLLQEGQTLPTVDMAVWLNKAQHAYTRASMDTAWLSTIHENSTRERMEATIRAVYHAICIYSHQALASSDEKNEQIEKSISLLEEEIEFLTAGSAHMFSHDIFVPLFILGTELWGNRLKQDTVERLFTNLLWSTGIWCNSTALQFLKRFWATPGLHAYKTWIQFARENEEQNGPFLVF